MKNPLSKITHCLNEFVSPYFLKSLRHHLSTEVPFLGMKMKSRNAPSVNLNFGALKSHNTNMNTFSTLGEREATITHLKKGNLE